MYILRLCILPCATLNVNTKTWNIPCMHIYVVNQNHWFSQNVYIYIYIYICRYKLLYIIMKEIFKIMMVFRTSNDIIMFIWVNQVCYTSRETQTLICDTHTQLFKGVLQSRIKWTSHDWNWLVISRDIIIWILQV